MAYLFLDDGGPEANEYASNYLYFDGSDSGTIERIADILSGGDVNDPVIRKRLIETCHSRPNGTSAQIHDQGGIDRTKDLSKVRNGLFEQTRRFTDLFFRRGERDICNKDYQQSTYGTALGT
jgi:hypothetical protein